MAQHANVSLLDLRCAGRSAFDRLFLAWAFIAHLAAAPRALLTSGDACIGPVARVLFKDRAAHSRVAPLHAAGSPSSGSVLLELSQLGAAVDGQAVSGRGHGSWSACAIDMSVAAANNKSKWVRSVPRLMRRLFRLADAVVGFRLAA